jgi:hypothetical protein
MAVIMLGEGNEQFNVNFEGSLSGENSSIFYHDLLSSSSSTARQIHLFSSAFNFQFRFTFPFNPADELFFLLSLSMLDSSLCFTIAISGEIAN